METYRHARNPHEPVVRDDWERLPGGRTLRYRGTEAQARSQTETATLRRGTESPSPECRGQSPEAQDEPS